MSITLKQVERKALDMGARLQMSTNSGMHCLYFTSISFFAASESDILEFYGYDLQALLDSAFNALQLGYLDAVDLDELHEWPNSLAFIPACYIPSIN